MSDDQVLDKIDRYYSGRLRQHGATPRGVDWNSHEAQETRFVQLFKLIDPSLEDLTILDYGCGYGAFAPYVSARIPQTRLQGYDVSADMVASARALHANERCRFTADATQLERADYVVASGIFSVKMDVETSVWEAYIERTISEMAELGKRGIAFNLLTAYSDVERMRPDLHYASPHRYFDYCRQFSRNVALLHDYGLYEFTIHIRF